jgi:transcription-repair coupling factor (superfamily II helicase)
MDGDLSTITNEVSINSAFDALTSFSQGTPILVCPAVVDSEAKFSTKTHGSLLSNVGRRGQMSAKQEALKEELLVVVQMIAHIRLSMFEDKVEQIRDFQLKKERIVKELQRLRSYQVKQQRFRTQQRKRDLELLANLERVSHFTGIRSFLQNSTNCLSQEVQIPALQRFMHFTRQQWTDLEMLFPILNACPLVADEAKGVEAHHFVLNELVFLERVQRLMMSLNQSQEASLDISSMINLRQLFLKDCNRFGPTAARNFIYLMVVCRTPLNEREKQQVNGLSFKE